MKKFSRKAMLGITAGVLAVIAIIGAGTFAWFTSSASAGAGEFTTAVVELNENGGEYSVYEFFNGHDFNIEVAQPFLENLNSNPDAEALFIEWLRTSNPNTWLVGMNQEDYNDATDYRSDLEQKIPDLQAALAEARRQYRTAAAAVDALDYVSNATLDYLKSLIPEEPIMPNWNDYGWRNVGQYVLDMIEYEVKYALYDAAVTAYEAAYDAAVEAMDTAEGWKDTYRAQRDEARRLRNEARDAYNDLMNTIFNNIVVNYGDAQRVTPGSIIYGKFEFENESNIDTYFRLKKGEDTGFDDVDGIVVRFPDNETIALEEGDDGWFYCPRKIVEGENIDIIVGAYIYGATNTESAMLKDLGIGALELELIQASNNAAILDSVWSLSGLPNNFFQN